MYNFAWFHCLKDCFSENWLLYAGRTIVGMFPTKYKAYKKRKYLQFLLDNFEFDQVRIEIDLLIEDMRDGK